MKNPHILKNVFFHVRSPGKRDWDNTPRQFLRLPVAGEYVVTNAPPDCWCRVEIVLHCAFEQTEYVAEVWAVKVDELEVKKDVFKD